MLKLFLLSSSQSIIQMMAQVEARRSFWLKIVALTAWWFVSYLVFFYIVYTKVEYCKEIRKIKCADAILIGGIVVCMVMFFIALGFWNYWRDVDYYTALYYFR